jgi:hypothetical protein
LVPASGRQDNVALHILGLDWGVGLTNTFGVEDHCNPTSGAVESNSLEGKDEQGMSIWSITSQKKMHRVYQVLKNFVSESLSAGFRPVAKRSRFVV